MKRGSSSQAMRGIFPSRSFAHGARCAMLFASVTLAGAAQAQSQGPAPSGTPAPTQTLSPTVPAPTLPTLSTPTQAPVIKPSAPIPDAPAITLPQATPSRAVPPARRTAAPAPRPTPAPEPQPGGAPAATPEATPTPTAQVPAVPSEPLSSDASATPEASASAEPAPVLPVEPSADSGPSWWPWAAGLGAVAVALAAFAWRRRRPVPVEAPADETVPVAPVTPPPAPPAPPPVRPAPAPAPIPSEPVDLPPANVPAGLAITLHADRLSATLVNATLSCRLVLTNHAAHALTDLALSGDMTSAHASRPMDEQLGLAGPELPPLRMVERLDPGQSLTIPAEMRLPLSAVLTIRAGTAQMFVPIVRAGVWATQAESGAAVHAHAAFLVGQPATPGDAAARLQPFRLDQGPRVFDTLDQRPMPLPAL